MKSKSFMKAGLCLSLLLAGIAGCSSSDSSADQNQEQPESEKTSQDSTQAEETKPQKQASDDGQQPQAALDPENGEDDENHMTRIRLTVNGQERYADLEDNATTRELIAQMPMTLPMMDLYGRELCYRYGAYALDTDNLTLDGYEVGDIAYWPPGGSLVILYAQNGEHFEREHLGHIEDGADLFAETGDCDVTFEVVGEDE